jgi:NADH:ubiquinone oxidoreductase subunit 6 (subunit J)
MGPAIACLGVLICAIQAIRATRLIDAALWLAGNSAMVALTMYELGAVQVAVIELSVGAGLVTVFLVFAIGIAGEERPAMRQGVPRLAAFGLVVLASLLAAALGHSLPLAVAPTAAAGFGEMLWQVRRLDLVLQLAIILSGVLGVLGLVSGEVPVARWIAPAEPGELPEVASGSETP